MTAGKLQQTSRRSPRGPGRQRGITLFGLLFWALIIGFGAYLVLRVFPTVNEFLTIRSAVQKIAAQQPPTVAEVRAAFDRQRDIEYSITSISGKDLLITKEDDRVVVAFAYDKLIPIYGPVYLLVKYEGRSK
ncbi:hypothetical protein D621_05995 [beta proteobacterium AAP51]|jgi:hypothetical protein|nr:hypothetical protein D621_05995 [beta proteobacterium AAP51]